MSNKIPHIIIVGGGAGGMELAAMLANKFGKTGKASITLVDYSPTHIWKPLLHEVAAGSLFTNENEIDYLAYAATHHFHFVLGAFEGLDRSKKEIYLSPFYSHDEEVLPKRAIPYDILIIAVGSVANDFNVPGVREHCLFLDNIQQAIYFHRELLNRCMRLSQQSQQSQFNLVVVGGGATGIELIAELHSTIHEIINYGIGIQPDIISFTLIEAANRLLTALPEDLSEKVAGELTRMGVKICLNQQVTEVTEKGLHTQANEFIPADLVVWTAGIKAPDFLRQLDGLEVNHLNQLLVKQSLQTTLDDSIFVLGDCASCPQANTGKTVPPRAQAAHQQASFLYKNLPKYFEGKPLPVYHYHDHGSLVTLSHHVIGNLMGKITSRFMIEGKLARLFYLSLHKQHQVSLYGWWRVFLLTLSNLLSRRVKPRLKLH
ncbi:NAD(P)/FAD-dependent oxidoreductase [Fluoribacter dumoffii]|uniref:NADH dehydrogenase n=1 Tax=Fluoribacter dumoffii TaxID=463 RepID=A0A377GC45_9GAMM|nr:NAD(P)/FAD-dependent oxidoreductase [Fluoribacter dumoffii]KTC90684.1 respiratory NADH dehydrogenase 2/cupric reductase [Fluoribacter dumoffii NY 23]MCW8386364.1 NAD(P)/FAD-dependent oxidoreductase [Fluoribacter dumoffii]MCW8419417.1 NAD(P)/FAD-dependent oxidoreductase [Fluoribacter dumoffii]MCW8452708.1 NAD(P)/FAD-dependent oxidoreductase [Fluoribacter dumoffii]MCW8460042.1 NAD(P)/FAD-dependent oxidoreductase [Fluoribacter dumoffii]